MVDRMNDFIGLLYRDLDVVSFEAIDQFIAELTPQLNA
jgi:hypothetical protein